MADGLCRSDKLNASASISPDKRLRDPKVEAPGLTSMNLRPRCLSEKPDVALHDDLRICKGRNVDRGFVFAGTCTCKAFVPEKKKKNVDREVVRVLVRERGKGPIWQRDSVEKALVRDAA